jgi:hypothetical protein
MRLINYLTSIKLEPKLSRNLSLRVLPVWRNGRRTGLKILSGAFSRGLLRFQLKLSFPRVYWHKSCFLARYGLALETSQSGTTSGTNVFSKFTIEKTHSGISFAMQYATGGWVRYFTYARSQVQDAKSCSVPSLHRSKPV